MKVHKHSRSIDESSVSDTCTLNVHKDNMSYSIGDHEHLLTDVSINLEGLTNNVYILESTFFSEDLNSFKCT